MEADIMKRSHSFELAIPISAVDHSLGPDHAIVTLVEYGDFECPDCRQAAPAVKMVQKRFAGQLCFVFRHFPLEQVHTHALLAAQAAECAGTQGKFWEMHDLLFEHQSHLQQKHLMSYAEQLQLDRINFTAELKDEIYLQRIREDIDGGELSGVRGTPTFYINGRMRDVSFGLHALIDGIEAVLQKQN
jgi:protein-disulfide isomerase